MKTNWKTIAPTIAVALALVPAAHAGVAAITGNSIVNGTVTGLDIKNGSVGTADVGQLTSADIANGSLTSADVKNGSLTLTDLAPSVQAEVTAPDPVSDVAASGVIDPAGPSVVGGHGITGVTRLGAGVYCVGTSGGTVATVSMDWAHSTPAGPTGPAPAPYRKDAGDVQASVATAACPNGVEVRTWRDIAGNMTQEDSVAFALVVAR